ncbi:hypothetical protein [Nocardia sp. NPDC056100]|uniref:hypothetical protein n=1 Tax=Nocardia sp. NPDC056100 TaxID=3345712 RepID=UPI0035DCA122
MSDDTDQAMQQVRQAIDSNVQLAIEYFTAASGIDFGLNRASLAWVEDLIEQQRAVPNWDPEPSVNELVSLVGSFLGACIAVETGGEWQVSGVTGALGVQLPNGVFVDPFYKAEKAIRQGVDGGESIASFHRVTVDHVAVHGV